MLMKQAHQKNQKKTDRDENLERKCQEMQQGSSTAYFYVVGTKSW